MNNQRKDGGSIRSGLQEQLARGFTFSTVPVLVKLTPNVHDINPHGLAARRGGAHGVSLINTIKSIIGVDIDNFVPEPRVAGKSTNGGYCGAAVRPIALHMVATSLLRHRVAPRAAALPGEASTAAWMVGYSVGT